MRCERCGTENLETSKYCKVCRAPLREGVPPPEPYAEEEAAKPTLLAHFLSTAWSKKGPILIALFVVLMMAMVFAPWAFLRLDILGLQVVSNSYSGWGIIIPRILFFLAIIPLLVALLMIAGIGTRRKVIETHICTFFGGVMFTVWIIIFALSQVIKSVVKNVQFIEVNVASGQVVTIFLIAGFILGIIITTYDSGKLLESRGEEG